MPPQTTGRISVARRWQRLAPDRFWSSGIESDIAGDDEGPCKGIELNIWERAKVMFSFALLCTYAR